MAMSFTLLLGKPLDKLSNMRKRIMKTCIFGLYILCTTNIWAQKFGYIDSEYILEQMPSYQEAQQKIDSLATTWEAQTVAKRDSVTILKEALQAEQVLLTESMIEERSYAIQKADKAAEEFQQKIFGYEGLYFLKQKELLELPQDELFKAVEKIAQQNKLQIVFDKSSDLSMVYTDPTHDYTEYVLEELGLSQKTEQDE